MDLKCFLTGAGTCDQLLRKVMSLLGALAAFAEDMVLVPSTHMIAQSHL